MNITRRPIVAAVLMAPAGDLARAAANAPLKSNGPAETPAVVPNRFDSIFKTVLFKPAAVSAKDYAEGDRVTRKIANILVEIGDTRQYIKGSIKAVQTKGSKRTTAELSFFGAVNQGSCLHTDDPGAQADLLKWKTATLKKFIEWREKMGSVSYIADDAIELDGVSFGATV